MPKVLPSAMVYSCTFEDYDYTFGPLSRTPNARFIRFGTSRPNRWKIWEHQAVPKELHEPSQTMINRRLKLFPAIVASDCDVAIYVDGNILIHTDLSVLIKEFWDSGADIALFKHPSGRTLGEEIDYALKHVISETDADLVEAQREKYGSLSLLDTLVTENTILFYRMESTKIQRLGAIWWNEIEEFCKRDQISLPLALREVRPLVHYWDWHFHNPSEKNVYFSRSGHRSKYLTQRIRSAAYFMKDNSWEYFILFKLIKVVGALRSALSLLFGRNSKTDKSDV